MAAPIAPRPSRQRARPWASKAHHTRPIGPQTNGKAERFIQTCLREWAYGRVWNNSAERTAWLPSFLAYYNTRRPHSAWATNLQLPGSVGRTCCNLTPRTASAVGLRRVQASGQGNCGAQAAVVVRGLDRTGPRWALVDHRPHLGQLKCFVVSIGTRAGYFRYSAPAR